MISNFRLQIVHAKDGVVVEWLPGAKIETDLVRELVYRLMPPRLLQACPTP